MASCPVCGKRMARFKNQDGSDRYVCPNENGHGAIQRSEGMARGGLKRRGKPNPAGAANLKKYQEQRKKKKK